MVTVTWAGRFPAESRALIMHARPKENLGIGIFLCKIMGRTVESMK
jgi:hypothetical protein